MTTDYLIQQVRDEIRRSDAEADVVRTVAEVLVNDGLDIRREPSLDAMKRILVEAVRAAEERHCMTC